MKKKFISFDESLEILDSVDIKPKIISLNLRDSLGYALAQDIVATINSPEFPTSSMDGYAVLYDDLQSKKIKIIDINPAGSVVESEVKSGTCIKTFTGSLIPKGADTLIPIENVTVEDDYIIINQSVSLGSNIRDIGENYSKGEVLIKKGTIIDFTQLGVMASLNIAKVNVYQKPTIAVASTGSEILDIGQEQTNDAQIRSSNHITLEAIAKKYGANVNQMGVVKDDKESILNLITKSLEISDIVVTTGGVSVGDFDFVKDIIKDKLGCKVLFHGVRIKPGQHIIVAQKDDKFIIGLPGFAYSSTVTFMVYALRLIFRLKGGNETLNIVDGIITHDFALKQKKEIFTAGDIEYKDGRYYIDIKNKKQGSSAILTNMLGKTGLLIQKEDSLDLKANDKVKILLY